MDITLAKQNNEREVKTYHCTRWSRPKVDGYLTLTTERVIFHGAATAANGKPTDRIVEEAELKSISGLSCFYGTQVNWTWILIGAFLALGAVIGAISCASLSSKTTMLDLKIATGVGCLLNIAMIFGGILIVALLGFGKAFLWAALQPSAH